MMETSTLLSAQDWAEQTCGSVRLGHRARSERAVKMGAAIAHDPAASLPAQMQTKAALHAAYRFLAQPSVSHEKLIQPHVQQTKASMGQVERVLLIQDTTEVDYQHHPTTAGLGPIGNGTHHGDLVQSVLAVRPESRQVLGLAHQEAFLRQPARHLAKPSGNAGSANASRRSGNAACKPSENRQQASNGSTSATGPVICFPFSRSVDSCTATRVIGAAQDRCVDLLVEQMETPVARRSHQKRRSAQEAQPAPRHLFEVVRNWSAQGEQDLDLQATKQSKARTAHVVISFGSLRLWPPRDRQASDLRPLVVWVERVWEPKPPEGVEPLEWVLLTWLPVQTVEQAWERVEWYRNRWIVEDYHQGLKTGCRIEQRQLQSDQGLRRLLGLLAPAAVRLLQLRAAARQSPELPASQSLPSEVVQVVAALAQVPAAQLTTQQCWHTIARYGGYLGRKGDGPPGWKTLWKGWFYIQALLDGVHLATRLSFDLDST